MTAHVGGFFCTWSSEPSADDGSSDAQAVSASGFFSDAGAFETAPLASFAALELNGALPFATCGRGGSRTGNGLSSATAWTGYIVTGAGVRFAASCVIGTTEWTIQGVRVDNGGISAMLEPNRFPPAGAQLQLGGAALAAFGGDPSFYVGVLTVSYGLPGSGYFGRSHFTEFVDIPPDTVNSPEAALRRIRAQLGAPSASFDLGTQSDGTQRVVRDCEFAGLDAAGILWLRPEDIGNQIDQIPNQVSQNSVQHFRFFPNAFFRRTRYVSGLHAPYVDTVPIDVGGELIPPSQPYVLRSVEFVPENSTWLLVLDGQAVCVRIEHPEGSDLRRPDEIWNAAIVPLLQTAQGPGTAAAVDKLLTFDTDGDVSGLIDRLKYVQFGRMLRINADGGGSAIIDIPQFTNGNNA